MNMEGAAAVRKVRVAPPEQYRAQNVDYNAVLPGTRATIADLAWLRARGLDLAIIEHARRGQPVLGICGGCQLLGRAIADPDGIEGAAGATEEGLGLLDLTTTFGADKTLRLHAPSGYEIHHGRVTGQTRAGAVEVLVQGFGFCLGRRRSTRLRLEEVIPDPHRVEDAVVARPGPVAELPAFGVRS